MKLKGSLDELDTHILSWYRSGDRNNHGRRNGLRLGQYLWNILGKDQESWPELFYAESADKAEILVRRHYLDHGK